MSFDPNAYDPNTDPTLGGLSSPTGWEVDHQDIDNAIANETSGGFDPGSAVGAAAVDIGTDTTQNKNTGGVPGLNTEPVGGSAPPGPNNLPEPSVTAAQQGAPGFSNTGGIRQVQGDFFAPENLPYPDRPTLPAGGGGQPQGTHEFLGAGPGYEIGGGYGGGMMFNDNMPMSTKLNEGWQPGGYIGKDTIVPNGNGSMDYGAFGLGAPDYGKTRFGTYGNGTDANGRPIDIAGFGTQGSAGGAPFGPGINMGYAGATDAQGTYNATLGMAPRGGGVAGLPAGAAAGTDTVLGTRPNLPAGAGGTAAAANPLQDQGQILRNPDGSIRGVASPNGYYDQRFQSEANILNNARQGDPFAKRDLAVLANAGDRNAAAELATLNGLPDFANSQLAAQWDRNHLAQIENRIPAEFANNNAAAANLAGQIVKAPTNPTSNFDALLGGDAHAQAVDLLHGMGASNVKIAPDPVTGKLQLTWDSTTGKPNAIDFTITNSSALIDALKGNPDAQRYIADQQRTTNRGGGGYGGGRSFAPRGGGGNQPQAPATPPEQNVPVQTQYGPGNRNTYTGTVMF